MGRSGQPQGRTAQPVVREVNAEEKPAPLPPAALFAPYRRYGFAEFCEQTLRSDVISTAADFELMMAEIRRLEPRSIAFDCEISGMEEQQVSKQIIQDGEERTLEGIDLVWGENTFPRLFQIGLHDPYKGISPRQFLVDLGPDKDVPQVDARALHELFGSKQIEKQIHFGDFEQEQWLRYHGHPIVNILDTCRSWMSIQKALGKLTEDERVAAGFAGWEKRRSSLAAISEYVLGFELPKEERESDWGADTLTDDQLRYAALDVAVLPPIASRTKLAVKTLKIGRKVSFHHYMRNKEVLDRVMPEIAHLREAAKAA